MTTWTDIANHIRGNFLVTRQAPTSLRVDASWDDGRSHFVSIAYLEVGEPMVHVSAPVGPRTRIATDELIAAALRRGCPFGVSYYAGDHVGLVHVAPLASMDVRAIDLPIKALAEFADELEREFTGEDELAAEGQVNAGASFCTACGAAQTPGAAFCSQCGGRL